MFSLKDAQTWPRGEQHELEAALISQRGNWKAKGVERKHTDNEQESYGTILRRWVAVLSLPWATTLVNIKKAACARCGLLSASPQKGFTSHFTGLWGYLRLENPPKSKKSGGSLLYLVWHTEKVPDPDCRAFRRQASTRCDF